MTGAGLLTEILSVGLARAAGEVRRFGARLVLGFFAVLAMAAALGFGLVAFSLWLTLHMAAWQAALLAGGAALALAAAFGLAARSAGRRRVPHEDVAAQLRVVLAEVAKEGGDMTPMAHITAAVAAGIVIGRMLSR